MAQGGYLSTDPNAGAETTVLSPRDESAFQAWTKANKITDVDHPDSHYDYRGYWKEHGDTPIRFGVDHFTDTYKQHGHPTFSVESQYSKGPADGGSWQGETYVPQAGGGYLSTDPNAGQAPTFHTENEKDAHGNAVVDPNTLGTLVRHFWSQVNPLQIGQMLPFPKALGGSGTDNPLNPATMATQLHAVKLQGDAAWDKGDHVGAVAKYVESVIPILGPMMAQQGDEWQGHKWAAAGGDTLGILAGLLGPKLLASKGATTPPAAAVPANALDASANAFAETRGIPQDAATATGNRFVRAIQGGAESSPLGSLVAERAQAARAAGLTKVGGELANEIHPEAATPESAGAGVRGSLETLVKDLHTQASEAYGSLRAMEANPLNAEDVPAPPPTTKVQIRMAESLGAVPTKSELAELRRIRAEMDEIRHVKRTWNDLGDETGVKGNAAGGHAEIVAGSAGAAVYDDILAAQPGLSNMSRGEVVTAIDRALETGQFTNAAKGAIAVARERLANPKGSLARRAMLPPGAGEQPTQRMVMPVDLTTAKAQLTPLRDRLLRERELTGVLMGDKGRALVALDALVSGPDFAPVSIVDAALGEIKAMARGADMPELRSAGQSAAAQAVKELGKAVFEAVDKVGPEARQALETGRGATTAKYATADVLDRVKAEPVQAYRQATLPGDTGIAHLRQIAEYAPGEIPKIGRAWLDQALGKATEQGGFDHAAKLQADWQRLGPETKRLLFGSTTGDLTQFFHLARRMAESPNPSKTALTLHSTGAALAIFTEPITGITYNLGAGGLAKLLHSPKGIALVLKAMKMPARAPAVGPVFAQIKQIVGADLIAAPVAGATRPTALPLAADRAPAETRR